MIEQFRYIWNTQGSLGCDAALSDPTPQAPAPSADRRFGPRSAGNVARWALSRAADILERAGRTRLRIAQSDKAPLTPHERSLQIIAEALAAGDEDTARSHAQWLVKPGALDAFLRALKPVTSGPAKLVAAA